jgi:hypothetical protein
VQQIDFKSYIKTIQARESTNSSKSPTQSLHIIHKKVISYREALVKKNKAIEHILDAIDEQIGSPVETSEAAVDESPMATQSANTKGFFSKIKGRMKMYVLSVFNCL